MALSLFPALVGAGALTCVGLFVVTGSWGFLFAAVLLLYGVPPVAFKIHNRFHPLREGPSHLVGDKYSPWWGGHQIQLLYIAFPALEEVLRLVPGLFSAWLRLWGSNIGKRVYWTPRFQIADRSLLTLGDDVVVGYDTGISPHLIKRTRKNILLYLKRVEIGDRVFLGAGVRIGPGAVVGDDAVLGGGVILYPRSTVKAREKVPAETSVAP